MGVEVYGGRMRMQRRESFVGIEKEKEKNAAKHPQVLFGSNICLRSGTKTRFDRVGRDPSRAHHGRTAVKTLTISLLLALWPFAMPYIL